MHVCSSRAALLGEGTCLHDHGRVQVLPFFTPFRPSAMMAGVSVDKSNVTRNLRLSISSPSRPADINDVSLYLQTPQAVYLPRPANINVVSLSAAPQALYLISHNLPTCYCFSVSADPPGCSSYLPHDLPTGKCCFSVSADPSAMMAGMSINESNSNVALIRMLAEEVVSLRK